MPIYLKIGPYWPNRQCCLAVSSKAAPRILIFSIAMGADHEFYMKTVETYARAFFKGIILSIGRVMATLEYVVNFNLFGNEHLIQPIYH